MATSDLSRSGSYLVLIVLDVEHTETRTVVDEFFILSVLYVINLQLVRDVFNVASSLFR